MKVNLDFRTLKYLLGKASGGGNGSGTNLRYEASTREVENTAGTNAILPIATGNYPGLLQRSERSIFKPTLVDLNGNGSYEFVDQGSFLERMGNFVFYYINLANIFHVGEPSNLLAITGLRFSSDNLPSVGLNVGGFTGVIDQDFYSVIARTQGGNNIPNLTSNNDIIFEFLDEKTNAIGQGSRNKTFKAVKFFNGRINVSGWVPIGSGSTDYVNNF